MKTRITEMLGIEYPIIQGGMAWVAEHNLAAAVSEAGGFGLIGGANAPGEVVRDEIRKARELTDKPFGVNVMLLSPHADDVAKVVVEEGIKVVTTGAGNPEKYMEMWKAAGIKVIPVVASVALARRMEKYGADAVVAEGMESGGHIGEQTTMTLVPQVADAVSIPVIAAGGIGDGRGMAAAFMLGAEAVQMGTRFVVAKESIVHENYKQRIIKAKDIDSTVTGRSHGHPVRGLRNQMTREYIKQLARVTDQVAQSQLDAKLERIRVEYTGKELDADTFRNLQKEIQDQITETKSALSQSYEYNLGALNLRLTRSQSGDIGKDDAAYITQQMYDELKENLDSELSENRMELELKGLNFQTQSISDAYQDALNEAMPDIESGINEVTKNAVTMLKEGYNDTITWDSDTVMSALGIKDIDKVSRKAIEELWKDMEPNYAELQKQAQGYLAAGKAVPQSIADGLADASAIGAIAGNQEAIWQLIALSISENGEYKKTIDEARKGGAKIPEEIAVYIDNNANIVDDAIIRLSNEAENTLQSRFGKMQVYGTVDFNMDVGSVTTRQSSTSNPHGVVVNGHAEGLNQL